MTDRELLELAAKAAGIKGWWEPTYDGFVIREDSEGVCVLWMPLADDGDALRLAVALDLIYGINTDLLNHWLVRQDWDEGCDKAVNHRRSIVRAAAEIGKGMK